jgi:hypothetical protein
MKKETIEEGRSPGEVKGFEGIAKAPNPKHPGGPHILGHGNHQARTDSWNKRARILQGVKGLNNCKSDHSLPEITNSFCQIQKRSSSCGYLFLC